MCLNSKGIGEYQNPTVYNVIKFFKNVFFICFFRNRGKVLNSTNNFVDSEPTNELAKSVVEQVNRIFLANLAADYPHLFEAQVILLIIMFLSCQLLKQIIAFLID